MVGYSQAVLRAVAVAVVQEIGLGKAAGFATMFVNALRQVRLAMSGSCTSSKGRYVRQEYHLDSGCVVDNSKRDNDCT